MKYKVGDRFVWKMTPPLEEYKNDIYELNYNEFKDLYVLETLYTETGDYSIYSYGKYRDIEALIDSNFKKMGRF